MILNTAVGNANSVNNLTDINIEFHTSDNPTPTIYHIDFISPQKRIDKLIPSSQIYQQGSIWSQTLLFQVGAVVGNGIANYKRINYCRNTPCNGTNSSNLSIPSKTDFHTNIFGSVFHNELFNSFSNTSTINLGIGKYINGTIGVDNFKQTLRRYTSWGNDVIVFQCNAQSLLERLPTQINQNIQGDKRKIILANHHGFTIKNAIFDNVTINDGTNIFSILQIEYNGQIFNQLESTLILGLTRTEYNTLNLGGLDNNWEAFINLNNKTQLQSTNNGVNYSSFQLNVEGYNPSTGDFLTPNLMTNPIKVYSVDGINFFSAAFTTSNNVQKILFNGGIHWESNATKNYVQGYANNSTILQVLIERLEAELIKRKITLMFIIDDLKTDMGYLKTDSDAPQSTLNGVGGFLQKKSNTIFIKIGFSGDKIRAVAEELFHAYQYFIFYQNISIPNMEAEAKLFTRIVMIQKYLVDSNLSNQAIDILNYFNNSLLLQGQAANNVYSSIYGKGFSNYYNNKPNHPYHGPVSGKPDAYNDIISFAIANGKL